MNINSDINLALYEFTNGDKKMAYEKLIAIFENNQNNDQLRFNIAVVEQSLDLNEKAKNNYKFLIEKNKNLKAIINLYLLYIKEENFSEALKYIEILVKTNFISNQIIKDQSFVLFKLKRYKESISICEDQLKEKNKDINFLNILGLNYFGLKQLKKSEEIFLKGYSIEKNNVSILNSLGRLYHEKRDSKNAEKFFLKAYNLNGSSYEIINNLAGFYREEAKYEDALKLYEKALKLNPNNPSIMNNLGKTYFDLDKLELSEKFCLKALSKSREDGNIQKILSLIYLKKQNYKDGWKYFDGRLNLSDFVEKNSSINKIKKKLYTKNNIDLNSNILILREQGVGDEILYGTMYADVFKNWKNVTIECDKRLKNLFQNSFKKYEKNFENMGKISSSESNLEKFDHVIYAGSLGKYFRNDKSNFEKAPYLVSNQDLVHKYKIKLKNFGKKYNIGISWRSFKNRYANEKSLNLDNIRNIFKNVECNIINLQYGDVEDEIENFNQSIENKIITMKDLDIFNDFDKLSAILKNLDLFLTVSNSTAHLAGALGVETFVIKPTNHAVFHYWDQPGNKTPWYDKITLLNRDELFENKNLIMRQLNT